MNTRSLSIIAVLSSASVMACASPGVRSGTELPADTGAPRVSAEGSAVPGSQTTPGNDTSGASGGGSAAAGGAEQGGPRAGGTRSVDSSAVEGDLPRPPGTMNNAEVTRTWDGLGSTGGATGTGVGVGTTASPQDGAPAQR